ncbi:MAG: 2-amino-4-hydroxy-6-hydroxymethyldihydropteridine diphosphokinase [Caldilineaceae bacterium]
MDKERNIPAALAALRAAPDVTVCVIVPGAGNARHRPGRGGERAGVLHNVAVHVRTPLAPPALRTLLRTIEHQLGRVRSADKFAPRPIDMDISLYDELIYDHDGMVIPDPDIARFPHVARPLAEIAPDWIVPTSGERLETIAARLANI